MNKIFDLENLQTEEWIDGIFSLPLKMKNAPAIPSRGEFVGYSSNEKDIYLFRDRIGARNLYYSRNNNKLYVSTDLLWLVKNAIPKDLKTDYKLNFSYLNEQYLKFQVPFNHETPYKRIYRVMPGEIVRFNRDIWKSETKYWKLNFGENKFNRLDLHDLITDAVQFRLEIIQDRGSYTTYCSGGIDSSTVTSLVKPKEFFCGYYENELYNEMNYVTSLKNVGVMNLVRITEEVFYKFLPHLPFLMPDPMGGLGVIPQLIVALEAFKKGYSYSFTGEGGDEIFYGYPWNTLVIEVAKAVRNLQRDKYLIRWESMTNKFLREAFFPMMINLIRRSGETDHIPWQWDKEQPVENNIMRFNIEIGLPAILTVDERVGLYSGVMPVSPLIDHNIVEYVASVNPEERTKIPKYLLRESMKDILPNKILNRYDKMGFPVPYEQWKWPMLQTLLSSLVKRGFPFELLNHKTMTREAWSLINVEMIYRILEEDSQE